MTSIPVRHSPTATLRPVPRAMGGDTPNPGALAMSLASVVMPALAGLSLLRGAGNLLAPPDHVGSKPWARVLGAGEIAVGIGLATNRHKSVWALARLGLDVLEFFDRARGEAGKIALGRRVVSVAVDAWAAAALAPVEEARQSRRQQPQEIRRSITIGKPAEELYRLWRDPEVQAQIWAPEAQVSGAGQGRLQWRLQGPVTVQFETEVKETVENQRLHWVTTNGAIGAQGALNLQPAPQNRGTEVTLAIVADEPMHSLLANSPLRWLAKAQGLAALQRFKALAETGEIPRSAEASSARQH